MNKLLHWKMIWNDIISDPDFRAWFINENTSKRPKYGGDFQIFKNGRVDNNTPKNYNDQKGTLYMNFGKLGHYVAYILDKDFVNIFDPSYSVGTYRTCFPDFESTVISYFQRPIKYITEFGTPQRDKNDTFCQTWSLSFLCPKTHVFLRQSEFDEIESLYNICSYFIASDTYKEIFEEQKEWIIKRLEENRTTNWDPSEIYMYSLTLSFEEFSKLFE